MLFVETAALGRKVYLPVQKETKLYYETKQYSGLDIVGTTPSDIRKGIKRWPKHNTATKEINGAGLNDINVMD